MIQAAMKSFHCIVTTLAILVVTGVQGWFFPQSQRSQVCYGEYGCFSKDPPFDQPLYMLPQSPSQVGVKFVVHRPNVPSIVLDPGDLSGLRPNLPTKVIVHGYYDRPDGEWITNMVQSLLERDPESNVVALDWRQGAGQWNYFQAMANTRLVGAVLAEFLQGLEQRVADPRTFHLIGHSLGAHAVGYAGRLRGNVGRITGLDPAGPGFQNSHIDVRLDPSDAAYVDVIHTNDAEDIINGFGMKTPMGTADFYPNGGASQPGCINFRDQLFQLLLNSRKVACDHMRAVKYFTESIRQGSCSFRARQCRSVEELSAQGCPPCLSQQCPVMGYDAQSTNASGILFLETNAQSPFCKNN